MLNKKLFLTRSRIVGFWLSTIFLAWCSLLPSKQSDQTNLDLQSQLDSLNEQIISLNWEINDLNWQVESLTTENDDLKSKLEESDDGYEVNSINTQDVEQLQAELEKYKTALIQEKLKNSSSSSESVQTATGSTTTKEIWLIKQIYLDANWNRKLEIDYVQVGWEKECNWWVFCIINENPKLRTFTISKNVEIVMQTFSHDADWSFKMWEKISFDIFKQKFNDTKQYDFYPHNYSNHLKAIPFWITIENNVITKIEFW